MRCQYRIDADVLETVDGNRRLGHLVGNASHSRLSLAALLESLPLVLLVGEVVDHDNSRTTEEEES